LEIITVFFNGFEVPPPHTILKRVSIWAKTEILDVLPVFAVMA
jgi:hypothetical protein